MQKFLVHLTLEDQEITIPKDFFFLLFSTKLNDFRGRIVFRNRNQGKSKKYRINRHVNGFCVLKITFLDFLTFLKKNKVNFNI